MFALRSSLARVFIRFLYVKSGLGSSLPVTFFLAIALAILLLLPVARLFRALVSRFYL